MTFPEPTLFFLRAETCGDVGFQGAEKTDSDHFQRLEIIAGGGGFDIARPVINNMALPTGAEAIRTGNAASTTG